MAWAEMTDTQTNPMHENATAPVLVHVGMPKTGTTTLQELLFSRHPEIYYLGQTNLWDEAAAKQVLWELLLDDPLHAEQAVALVGEGLKNKSAVVISDEALTFGEYMLRASQWPIHSDHVQTAKRIKAALGQVHILLVLRNQADWLVSWHRQGLKTGKYAETDYKQWLEKDLGASAEHMMELLHYDKLFDAFASVFGADHVHVHFFEECVGNFPDLAAEVADLLGIDQGIARQLVSEQARNVTGGQFAGLAPVVQRFVRQGGVKNLLSLIPKFLRRALRGLLVRERTYEAMGEDDITEIRAQFAESNRRLFSALGKEKAPALGYF